MAQFIQDDKKRWWNLMHIVMVTQPRVSGSGAEMGLVTVDDSQGTPLYFADKNDAWSFFEAITGYGEEDCE